MRRCCIILLGTLLTTPVFAGVPQVIHPISGDMVGWKTPEAIPAHLDRGPLGRLNNAQARALVDAMMDVWGFVETSSVRFVNKGLLPADVTAENAFQYVNGTVCADEYPPQIPSMQRGESPIIFDDTGEIIDLLAGVGASRKIVGKAAFRCYEGTLDNPTAATQAFAIFNGLFINDSQGENDPIDLDINTYAGVVLHELGHFLGLHHSMVNETVFHELLVGARANTDSRYLPVMYPLVLRGAVSATVLKPDDVAAISALYPNDSGTTDLATVSGLVMTEASAGFRGANIVARRQDDPLCQAVSTVSGRFCTPLHDANGQQSVLGDACSGTSQAQGEYRVDGLSAGIYSLEVSELSSAHGARKNMFPKSGSVTLPGVAEYYNLNDDASESSDEKTMLHLGAGEVLSAFDFVLGTPSVTTAVVKAIDLSDVLSQPETTCDLDPVNYEALVASVQDTPDLSSPDDPSTNSVNAADRDPAFANGCAFVPRASDNSELLASSLMGLLFVGSVLIVCTRSRRLRSGMVLCGLILVIPWSVQAETGIPVAVGETFALAGHVVHGTCRRVERRWDTRGFLIFDVTYDVHTTYKGASTNTLHFQTVAAMVTTASTPATRTGPFRVGSEEVLSLYPESRWGYTSPVAGAAGIVVLRQNTPWMHLTRLTGLSHPVRTSPSRAQLIAQITPLPSRQSP